MRRTSHYPLRDGLTSCGLKVDRVVVSNMPDCSECLYQELREVNMSKHTPGPWYVNPETTDRDISIYRKTKPHNNPEWVARVYGTGTIGKPNPERVANAHLIAAAPELLEALKTVHADAGQPWNWLTMIELVMAKAEGRE